MASGTRSSFKGRRDLDSYEPSPPSPGDSARDQAVSSGTLALGRIEGREEGEREREGGERGDGREGEGERGEGNTRRGSKREEKGERTGRGRAREEGGE